MIDRIKTIIRDFRKRSIEKKFSQFSRFKGDSRANELRELGLYVKSIQSFSYQGDCLDQVLAELDCIRIDEGWHIGQQFLFKNKKVKCPFLYCYKNKSPEDFSFLEEIFTDRIYKTGEFEIKDNPVSIYNHIRVTPSVMGAWQVFLLESFPFIDYEAKNGHSKREAGLVFSYADMRLINKRFHSNIEDKYDLRPYVWMKNNVAYVTCCEWNEKNGLGRICLTIIFKMDRVVDVIKNYEILDNSRYVR
jgi:hypothetical protein